MVVARWRVFPATRGGLPLTPSSHVSFATPRTRSGRGSPLWKSFWMDGLGCDGPIALNETLLTELAPFCRDLVPLSRPANNPTPTLGDEFRLRALSLQPVAEATVHSFDGKPGG